jgi:hypothetical protein
LASLVQARLLGRPPVLRLLSPPPLLGPLLIKGIEITGTPLCRVAAKGKLVSAV